MSTKIFNGYRIHDDYTQPDVLLAHLKQISVALEKHIINAIGEAFPGDLEQFYSVFVYPNQGDEGKNYVKMMEQFGFDAEVCVYFRPNGQVLLTIHGGKNGSYLLSQLAEFKQIAVEYPYWDNTDPDESCTGEEWEQRRLDWSFLTIPIEDGFSYMMIDKESITQPFYFYLKRTLNGQTR